MDLATTVDGRCTNLSKCLVHDMGMIKMLRGKVIKAVQEVANIYATQRVHL